MGCDIAIGTNRGKVCDNLQGGVTRVYFFNLIDNAFTVTAGVVTAINVALTTVYEYVVEGDGNTYTQVSATDKKVGTKVNTQTLVAQLKAINAASNIELDKLVSGYISGVAKDRNGVYHWFAKDGVNVTATAESVTGGAPTDFNGYNVTLVAETLEKAPTLDSASITALLALVP